MKSCKLIAYLVLAIITSAPIVSLGAGAQQISSAKKEDTHKTSIIISHSKSNQSLSQDNLQKIVNFYKTSRKVKSALPVNPLIKPIQEKVEKWAIKKVEKQITQSSDFFLDKTTTMIIILILVLIFVLAVAAGRDALGAFLDILMIVLILIIIFLLLKLLEVI